MFNKIFKRYKFLVNDRLTRENFTHINEDNKLYFTVADPDEFFRWHDKLGFDLFEMQCLQKYYQCEDGKWKKLDSIPFINYKEMKDSGIEEL